jgi:hypothetical protein
MTVHEDEDEAGRDAVESEEGELPSVLMTALHFGSDMMLRQAMSTSSGFTFEKI